MIVTFDSGVYISAMRFGGVPEQTLLHAVLHHQLIFCAPIEDEILRVMEGKFDRTPDEIKPLLLGFWANAKRVAVTGELTGICRDPDDDCIIECASVGAANLIVTGDKDLLSLGAYRDIRIVTPRMYLDMFRH